MGLQKFLTEAVLQVAMAEDQITKPTSGSVPSDGLESAYFLLIRPNGGDSTQVVWVTGALIFTLKNTKLIRIIWRGLNRSRLCAQNVNRLFYLAQGFLKAAYLPPLLPTLGNSDVIPSTTGCIRI